MCTACLSYDELLEKYKWIYIFFLQFSLYLRTCICKVFFIVSSCNPFQSLAIELNKTIKARLYVIAL